MEVIMNQNDALNVLARAVSVAQSKGAYSLEEAALIAQAVAAFSSPEESVETPAAEEPTKVKKTSNKK